MSSFTEALHNIEPTQGDKDTAPVAHEDVRYALTKDETLRDWGLATLLMGSYKRRVSIRRVNDVDVFCMLDTLPTAITGKDVLDHFYDVLAEEYGEAVLKRQKRSIKVELAKWNGLHVDIVPARRASRYWEIPAHGEENDWQETNPDMLTTLTQEMNRRTNDLYVPTVKLLRQTRRNLLANHPGGFWVEMTLYEAINRGLVAGTNQRSFYVGALSGVARVLSDSLTFAEPLPDPTRPGEYLSFRATDNEWKAASEKFDAAAQRAAQTDEMTRCQAEATFRDLLGKNSSDNWVYPLPDDCNADGSDKFATTIAGEPIIKGGNQRFA